MTDPVQQTSEDDKTTPEMRPWRQHYGFSLLRLRVDVVGASRIPGKMAGDLVLASWNAGKPMAVGWMLHGIGFSAILNEPDVEVIEKR